jgi:hypothetical protein
MSETQDPAAVDEVAVTSADALHLKMAALRLQLETARSRIAGGKRANMIDQVADGCCDAIDAILATLP